MLDDIIIKAEKLSKSYKVFNSPIDRVIEALTPFYGKRHHVFPALEDLNFEIRKGDVVGIVGKNGSGKSTLLKILTGVVTPTSGNFFVNGKVSALLELGAGFNPELSGIDNIYFNTMLLGFSKEEIDTKLDDILTFADIGDFAFQPIKTYSSGMFMRLAFAVAVSVEPDVFIVDEAMSVGDIFFQQKCFKKMRQLISSGVTILLVSHDMKTLQNLCTKTILLNGGKLLHIGCPIETASMYNALSSLALHAKLNQSTHKQEGCAALISVTVRILDMNGRETDTFPIYQQVAIEVAIDTSFDINIPNVGLSFFDKRNNLVYGTSTVQNQVILPRLHAGTKILVKFDVVLSVEPGEYTLVVGCSSLESTLSTDGSLLYRQIGIGPIKVLNEGIKLMKFHGIAELPTSIEYVIF